MLGDGLSSWMEIQPPVITTPPQGAVFTALLGFTATLDIFVSSITVQTSTDWEVWTGLGGTGTRVFSAAADTLNKLLKVVPGGTFVAGTAYFLRARFRSATFTSDWSADRLLNAV
jgi:hypothetical protein